MWGGATTYDIVIQAVTVAMLGLYCWTVYYFRGPAGAALKSVATLKIDERAGIEQKQQNDYFLAVAMAMLAIAGGVLAAKIAVLWSGWWWFWGAPLGVGALVAGVVVAVVPLMQFGVLKIAGALTFSSEETNAFIRIKQTCIAALALVAVPTLLVFSGRNVAVDRVAMWIGVAEAVVAGVSVIVQTAILVKKRKISFLVWFLYLCTVEIFPLALVGLTVAKNV